MLNCKQKAKHLRKHPDHEKYLLTSMKYANENKFKSLASSKRKIFMLNDGEYIMLPLGPLKRFRRLPLEVQ